MTFRSLYHTEVINNAGLNGHARVTLGGDLDVLTSSPLQDDPGTNPEQLLGLALATCLNATIEAEEGRRGLEHAAEVKVGVDMGKDTEGYQFFLDCQVRIPQVAEAEAQEILVKCERRCPVSKIVGSSQNVRVHLVKQFAF